jgi:hypothetical protein
MFRALASRFRGTGPRRSAAARTVRSRFPPTLERLEDRLVLDTTGTFYWTGAASGFWNNANNWSVNGAVPNRYPGSPGNNTDSVEFDGRATADCLMASLEVTLAKLQLDGGTNAFGKSLALTSSVIVVQGGTFEFDGGELDMQTATRIDLDNSTGNWKGGDFSSAPPPPAGGNVYVFNGSTLNVLQAAQKLGASLVIGQDKNGSDSNGTLNISSTTVGMSGNLTLYQNANITNCAKGTINFLQDVNSATKGGIVVNAGGTSVITSAGTINRTTVDTTGQTLQVLVPTTQGGSTNARFNLGAGCAIQFQNAAGKGLHIINGRLKEGARSSLGGDIKVDSGAFEELGPPDQTGTVSYSINGALTLGGTLVFDYAAGSLGQLQISGDFTMNAGTLDINVDGSTNGACDRINVGGAWALNGGYLYVNTVNASPQVGWAYQFVTAASRTGSGWGSTPSNGGYSASYYFDSSDPGKLDVGTQPPPPPP